jgi:ABC-type transport system involved in cytochrome bd biosynthesis fused ATPase/permease subunit
VRYAELLKSVPDIIAGAAAVAVIWIGSRDNIDTGTIAGALAALGITLKPMRDLATVWNHGAAFSAAHNKCVAALNRRRRRESPSGTRLRKNRPVAIRFEQANMPPIHALSAEIAAGSRVRLSGENGTGKSRMMKTLAGLDAVANGRITLNNQDLTRLSQGSLRRQVVRIGSDPTILKGTLRKALTLGLDRRPDDTHIIRVARSAGLDAMLQGVEDLDGNIAEGGRDLSSGLRVKIALVRAMLSQPGLILIDSSAAQLDATGRQTLTDWLQTCDATVVASEQANLGPGLLHQELTLPRTRHPSSVRADA